MPVIATLGGRGRRILSWRLANKAQRNPVFKQQQKRKAKNLKEHKVWGRGYMGGFGGRKGVEEMMSLCYNLKNKGNSNKKDCKR